MVLSRSVVDWHWSGGELPVAATMIADHYTGTQRSRMLVLVDSFWAFGWIAASLLAFLVMPHIGWRMTVLITALMGLYALLLRRHLPAEQEANRPQKLILDRHCGKCGPLNIAELRFASAFYGL